MLIPSVDVDAGETASGALRASSRTTGTTPLERHGDNQFHRAADTVSVLPNAEPESSARMFRAEGCQALAQAQRVPGPRRRDEAAGTVAQVPHRRFGRGPNP